MDPVQTTARNSLELENGSPQQRPQEVIVDIDVDMDEAPDGGINAWMTVAASFLASFMAFGTGTSLQHLNPRNRAEA